MTTAHTRTGTGGFGRSYERLHDTLTALSGPGKPSGDWLKFTCPAHDDRVASLGIKYDAAQERTVLTCYAHCPDTDVLAAIGHRVADLFDNPLTRSSAPARRRRRPAPADTSTPPPATPAPTPARPRTLGTQTGPKKQIAVYTYTDADGNRIGQVTRTETPYENGIEKGFYQRRWDDQARRWKAKGFPPVLYRLPDVAAAIATDTPVYVVEGEKDADNAAAIGIVATTNAQGGGRGKFKSEHAEQLRGAHVTVVADRDPTGYHHAIEVRDRLAGIAASVTIVAAAAGKDLSDHLAAGHRIDQLVPLDPDAELAPTTNTTTTAPPRTSLRAIEDDDLAYDDTPEYGYRGGHTVLIRRRDGKVRTTTIWRCEARLIASPIEDYGYDTDAQLDPRRRTPAGRTLHLTRRITGDDGDYLRDDTGNFVTETATVTLDNDELHSPEWPDLLPWPRLIHDTSPRGRSKALEAADLATPTRTAHHSRRYLSTGWHAIDGQNVFLHAAGAIGKDGPVLGLDQQLEGKLGQITMADPEPDVMDMMVGPNRALGTLLQLNPKIVAPLIGFTFRSLLSPPAASIHLVGPPASGKTAIVRNASLQFLSERFCEDIPEHRDMFCGADNIGDTTASLMHSLHRTKDVPVLIDDFNGRKAAQRLADIQRAVWNSGGRQISTIKGTNRSGGAPRAGLITTGESGSLGSAATRTLTINVGSRDLTDDPVNFWMNLENPNYRWGRATMGATYVKWLARDLAGYREWADNYHRRVLPAWAALCSQMSHEPSVRGRLARTAALITTGWGLLLRFLRDHDAIDLAQADDMWTWAMEGLRDQLHDQDPTMTDGAIQVVELIRSALTSGAVHLTDRTGNLPCDPTDGAAGRAVGWHGRHPTGLRPDTPEPLMWQPRGNQVGIVTDTDVWLYPDETLATATARADRAGETMPHTKTSLTDALIGRGWMTLGKEGKRRVRRRIGGVMTEVWIIPRAVFFGTDDDPDPHGTVPDDNPDTPTLGLPLPPWDTGTARAPDPTTARDDHPDTDSDAHTPVLRVIDPTTPHTVTHHPSAVVTDTELILPDGTRVWMDHAVSTMPDLLQFAEQIPIETPAEHAPDNTAHGPDLYLTDKALRRFDLPFPSPKHRSTATIDAAAHTLSTALRAALAPHGYRTDGTYLIQLTNAADDPDHAPVHARLIIMPLIDALTPARFDNAT